MIDYISTYIYVYIHEHCMYMLYLAGFCCVRGPASRRVWPAWPPAASPSPWGGSSPPPGVSPSPSLSSRQLHSSPCCQPLPLSLSIYRSPFWVDWTPASLSPQGSACLFRRFVGSCFRVPWPAIRCSPHRSPPAPRRVTWAGSAEQFWATGPSLGPCTGAWLCRLLWGDSFLSWPWISSRILPSMCWANR